MSFPYSPCKWIVLWFSGPMKSEGKKAMKSKELKGESLWFIPVKMEKEKTLLK